MTFVFAVISTINGLLTIRSQLDGNIPLATLTSVLYVGFMLAAMINHGFNQLQQQETFTKE